MKMGLKRCCAAECYNSHMYRPDLAYFCIPKNVKYAHLWASAAGRDDLKSKPTNVYVKYHICSEHFEPHCFADPPFNKKLKINRAPRSFPIPTIFKNNLLKYRQLSKQPISKFKISNDPSDPLAWTEAEMQLKISELVKEEDNEDSRLSVPLKEEKEESQSRDDGSDDYIEVIVIPEPMFSTKYENESNGIDEITKDQDRDDQDRDDQIDILNDNEEIHDAVKIEVGRSRPDVHLCRLCALAFARAKLVQIFADSSVAEIVTFVLAGQITEDDSLSQFVCTDCLEKANECFKNISAFREAQRIQFKMQSELN